VFTRLRCRDRVATQPMRAVAVVLALLSLLPAAVLAHGAPPLLDPEAPGLDGSQRLQALIERVKDEQKKLRTLEADFVQHKNSALLAAPEESRGTFSYQAPDRVRWEYDTPKAVTLLIRDQEMTTWYRDLNRAERLNVGRYSTQILRYMGAGGSIQDLLQYFSVSFAVAKDRREPYRLDLVPRYSRMTKRLKSISLWIDRQRFLPVRLLYVEPDGDSTEYRFSNIRFNAGLPADRFDLQLPQNVEVRTLHLDHGAGPQ